MFRESYKQLRLLVVNSGRLFRIAPKELRGFYISLGALALALSCFPLLADAAWGEVINILSGSSTHSVWVLLLGYLFVSETIEILSAINDSVKERLKNRLSRVFGVLIPLRKSALTPEDLERPDMQNQIAVVAENAEGSVCEFVTRWFEMVQCALVVVATVVVLSTFSWLGALLVLVSMVPALYIESHYGRDFFALEGELAEPRRRYDSNSWDMHLPRMLVAAKVLGMVPLLIRRIEQDLKLIEKGKSSLEQRYLPRKIIAQCLTFLVVSGFILYLVREVTSGRLELGTANFYLATMEGLRIALREFFQHLGDQLQDSRFVTETFELFKNGKHHHEAGKESLPAKPVQEIAVRDLGYTYPTGDKPVLNGVSASFKRGTITAIVGGNGSGKTTLLQVLAGIRKPTTGLLSADAYSLNPPTVGEWWSQHVEYLSQQPSIFDALTVGEHILRREKGEPKDDTLLPEMGGVARIHRTVSRRLPRGYDSRLSSSFVDGRTLSGGQRQRLSWAPVLASGKPIWLLDEPFSALDRPVTEHFVGLLRTAARQHGRTIILVTHDPEIAKQADNILVMEGGRIVENGTYAELAEQDSKFTRLFQSDE